MSILVMGFSITDAKKHVVEMRHFLQKSLQKAVLKNVGIGHAACLVF